MATGCGTLITPPSAAPSPTAQLAGEGASTPTGTAAAFFTPLPPTPTLTPSPTPTPVFYTVQSGDTLLGIALEYGISLDALQAANGLDDSQYLSIGQALIIPLGEEDAPEIQAVGSDSVILPTPTPLSMELAGISLSRTPVGGFLCMGEVINRTDGATTNMQVQAVLVDASGAPLVSGIALVAADYLAPGERAPFSVLFRDPPDTAVDVTVQVLRAEAMNPATANFVPLTAVAVEGSVSGPQYRVAGQVVNETGGSVERVQVVAVLYNKEGLVMGYRETELEEGRILVAGERAEFAVLLIPQGGKAPESFKVLAWGSSKS